MATEQTSNLVTLRDFVRDAGDRFTMAGVTSASDVKGRLEAMLAWISDTAYPHMESSGSIRAKVKDAKDDAAVVAMFADKPTLFSLNMSLFADLRPMAATADTEGAVLRVMAFGLHAGAAEDPGRLPVVTWVSHGVFVIFVRPVVTTEVTAATCPLYFYNVPAVTLDMTTGALNAFMPLTSPAGAPLDVVRSYSDCTRCVLAVVRHVSALASAASGDVAALPPFRSPIGFAKRPESEADGTASETASETTFYELPPVPASKMDDARELLAACRR